LEAKILLKLVYEKGQNPAVKPKVTIGICVKDCEKYVREALKSIAIQNFPHEFMEVIVIDDGSKDKTLSIVLDTVVKMNMRVKVFHTEWRGLGAARNTIVKNASGDYIIWVDGDMILPEDHVKIQVDFMEKNPKIGIAKAKHKIMFNENLVAILENIPFILLDADPEKMNTKLPGTGGAIYRVSAIRQVGGFDECLKGTGEDQDGAYRVKAAGWLICQSPATFYERRVGTWRDLWKKYVWYGYGDHDLYCKNRNIFSLYKMNPVIGFVTGIVYACKAYKLTGYKGVCLLPFHFFFKLTAWCAGFAKARGFFFKTALTKRK